MREIKFRAWDKERRRFLSPFSFAIQDGCVCSIDHGEMPPEPDWIIEQFTCLKDQFNVEIYEGDIIQHVDQEAWPKSQAKVFWHVNTAQFVFGTELSHSPLNHPQAKRYEIIGNIHENEVLLK